MWPYFRPTPADVHARAAEVESDALLAAGAELDVIELGRVVGVITVTRTLRSSVHVSS